MILINLLLAIHVIVSLLIILLTLMQRPKNEGLGAAFGGGMTENLFGADTSNVLQTATRWLGGMFFALTLLLSYLYVKMPHGSSKLQQQLSAPTTIVSTPAPMSAATPAAVEGTPSEASSVPVESAASPAPAPSSKSAPATTSDSTPATPAAVEESSTPAASPGTEAPSAAPAAPATE